MLKVNQLIGFTAKRASASVTVDSNIIWICGGYNGGLLSATQKYDLGSGTVSSGATLNTARAAGMAGSDNVSKAVISHGYNIVSGTGYTNTTEKISLPSGSWTSSATVANQAGRMGGGCSTGTHLFGALADNPTDSTATDKTEKYNFSADTSAAGGTMTNAMQFRHGSHGTSATSYIPGGRNNVGYSVSNETYAHSSDTSTNETAIASSVGAGSAAGNATYMYYGDHTSSSFTATRKYTLSSKTDAAGTALSQTHGIYEGCGSNNAKQLWAGGIGTGTKTTIYTFSGDTTANGTAITSVDRTTAVFGEAPGGLN